MIPMTFLHSASERSRATGDDRVIFRPARLPDGRMCFNLIRDVAENGNMRHFVLGANGWREYGEWDTFARDEVFVLSPSLETEIGAQWPVAVDARFADQEPGCRACDQPIIEGHCGCF